ncbi:MAG: sugar ABC transporter permease [Firmicutes bacterium]|nr:sugar ABC transporter permease [Bacillota bacterium]
MSTPYRRTWQWWRVRAKIFPYVGISAFYLRFLIFTLYPFYYSIVFSTRQMTSFTQSEFVGLRNFWLLFARDTFFLDALIRALVYALASAITHIPVAFVLAYIFNEKIIRGRNILRICYLLPLIVSGSVIATLASMAFNQQVGLVNQILGALRLPNDIVWLDNARYTMLLLVLLAFWRYTGYHMIVYLAGLQAMDPALYEAARIDGASETQVLLFITVPNMRPAMAFSLITSLIGSFQLFDLPQIIWPGGGPEHSAFFPLNYIYYFGLREFRLGEACAAGWILFLVTVFLSVGWYKLLRIGRED